MHKVVICPSGSALLLSSEARDMYNSLKGEEACKLYDWDIPRHDPDLVTVVEKLGNATTLGGYEVTVVPLSGNLYRIVREDLWYEYIEEPNTIQWINAEEPK